MKNDLQLQKSFDYEEAKRIKEMLDKLPKETRKSILDIINGATLVNVE